MRRAVVILVISAAYMGCAGRSAPEPQPREPARQGRGVIRVLVAGEAEANRLFLGAVGRPLNQVGFEATTADVDDDCRVFELDPAARFADGSVVRPEDWIAAWRRGRSTPDTEHEWLLEPLDDPLTSADGSQLRLCTSRPVPDLVQRLSHPDLWLWRRSPATGQPEGPGPFAGVDGNALVANSYYDGPGPLVERVEFVGDAESPALMLELGQAEPADVVTVDDRQLRELKEPAFKLGRLAEWDRVYALWSNPGARWLNDPTLRRWLAGRIDREAMLEYLFAGQGEPAFGLLEPGPDHPAWAAVTERPLAPNSVPRLELQFDGDDPHARRLARRLRGELQGQGIELTLDPRPLPALHEAIAAGREQMVLLAHRPPSSDPVLALFQSFRRLGRGAAEARLVLEQATLMADPGSRRRAAEYAEQTLMIEARLVPLVRVHAWLALAPGLTAVASGPNGTLDLTQARWLQ